MSRQQNYINGLWVDPATGRWRPVDDPSSGKVFAEVADSGPQDADRAVQAARRAFDDGPWPRLAPETRRNQLLRLAEILAGRSAELIELITRDAGCPVRLTDMLQVSTPIGHLFEFAEHALLLTAKALPISHEPSFGQSEVRREPLGVCVGFTPYNFPLFMNIWKLAPALAMGNTVVLKPSPLTPLAATVLAEGCEEAGIPPGVVNVVHGDAGVGAALVEHPQVNRVSFTGSTQVGRQVMAAAAGTVKRVALELGGKSASLVLDDADMELAVRGSLFGSMVHAGQGCVCTTRMLVPRSQYAEYLELLRARAGEITVGPATEFTSDIGPLISGAQREKVERYVGSAVDEGARILLGGGRPSEPGLEEGYYFAPTVLFDVTPDMRIAQEEVFGPVLAVLPYESTQEAVALANDSIYGLGGVVWGGDLRRAREVAGNVEAGTVWVNDFGVINPNGPFGGYKQSGLGRELSPDSSLEYTEAKHLYTSLDCNLDTRPYALVCLGWD